MSYPITCEGGFAMPLIAGKHEIVGIRATIEDPTATAQLAIFDDTTIKNGDKFGKLIAMGDIYTTKHMLADSKTVASTTGEIWISFEEPIKTRYGISIAADNIEGGSICLYRR